MSTRVNYQHLEARSRSNYRQLWVKGRHMRAEVLYRLTVNLYLDDDSAGRRLAALLSNEGHGVVVPAKANLSGAPDAQHFRHAIAGSLVLVTRNHDDFVDRHEVVLASRGTHPGILVVRFDNDPKRDMSDRLVARAIANLQSTNVPLENQVYILNHWR